MHTVHADTKKDRDRVGMPVAGRGLSLPNIGYTEAVGKRAGLEVAFLIRFDITRIVAIRSSALVKECSKVAET